MFSVQRLLLAGLAAVSSVAVYAQPVPLKVEKLAHKGTMPYVEGTGPAPQAAAARMNQVMFLQVLELAAPLRRQDGVKAAKAEGGGMEPVSGISFKVNRLDARALSLTVSFEGCGAYCEAQQVAFNFDARSGREIVMPDLFTPAGVKAVTGMIDGANVARVEQHLKRLRAAQANRAAKGSKAGGAAADDDAQTAAERIELFETCLKSMRDPERGKFRFAAEEPFNLEGSRIVFHRGRCSIHAMQALDELGDFSSPLEVRLLEPHLSAYGRHVLLGGPESALPPSAFRSVMKGKVGTAPITLYLRSPGYEQSVSGFYFYDRFRTPIPLFGKFDGSTLALEEPAPEGKEAAALNLRPAGEGLKGEWVGGGKRLPVEAAP